jgi:hypothetical protein
VSAGTMAHGRPGYLVSQTIAQANRVLMYFWMVATFVGPHRELPQLRLRVQSMSSIVLGECHEVYEALGATMYAWPDSRIHYSQSSKLSCPIPWSHFINLSLFFSPLFHSNLVQLYFTIAGPRSLYFHYFSIGLKQKPESLLISISDPTQLVCPKASYYPTTKMAGREFTLSFETTPPTAVKPGSPFTIPVIIAVNPIGTPAQNVQHLVVSASLRDEAGTGAAVGLSGNLTASVRSRADNSMSGYAKLSPLTISQPGRFRLRVMLSAASYNGVVTKEYVDSTVIHVHAGAAAQRPSGSISFALCFGTLFTFPALPSRCLLICPYLAMTLLLGPIFAAPCLLLSDFCWYSKL